MPTNITRGNVEGMIAIGLNIVPAAVSGRNAVEQYFDVPGLLSTDVVISVSAPGFVSGITVVNAKVSSNNSVGITFTNNNSIDTVPVPGKYILVLGRLSNNTTVPIMQF
jgi:hypothetical protein